MKQTLKRTAVESLVVVIPCAVAIVFVIFSRDTEIIYEQVNKYNSLLLSEVLLIALLVSLCSIIILGLNYRRLFQEINLRKAAEEEIRILRHANKARAAEIMLALDENEFQVYYQSIVELKTERICAFEALVRWNHPTHGIISPASFMPFIEESDLIVPLTKFMVRSVVRQISEWKDNFPNVSLPVVSINLSWQHNKHSDAVKDIKEILDEFEDFVPHHLCFELTETTAAQNIEQAIELTRQLRELGSAVSIDDFGTGYSSLSYLGDIPITSVKIDRSFIKRMLEQSRSDIVVRSIIKMAHELNLKVIAEGIETELQMLHLLNLGCEFGQGYLFARPLPINEINKMIAAQARQSATSIYPQTSLDYIIETA